MTTKHHIRLLAFFLGALVLFLTMTFEFGAPERSLAELDAAARGLGERDPGTSDVGESPSAGAFIRRNPFQIERLRSMPTPPPAPTPDPAVAASLVPTRKPSRSLPVKLIGTIAGGGGGMAFLQSPELVGDFVMTTGGDLGVHLGRTWAGTILTRVERRRVIFTGPENQQYVLGLRLGMPGASVPEPPPVVPLPGPPGPAVPPPPTRPLVEAGPGGEIHISRAEVDSTLKNLGFLITQLNVQPYFERGKPAGFRVSRVRPGSFVARLGARNGDVLRAVNGKPIRSVRDSFLLYNGFRTGKQVQLEVLRSGKRIAIRYDIR